MSQGFRFAQQYTVGKGFPGAIVTTWSTRKKLDEYGQKNIFIILSATKIPGQYWYELKNLLRALWWSSGHSRYLIRDITFSMHRRCPLCITAQGVILNTYFDDDHYCFNVLFLGYGALRIKKDVFYFYSCPGFLMFCVVTTPPRKYFRPWTYKSKFLGCLLPALDVFHKIYGIFCIITINSHKCYL